MNQERMLTLRMIQAFPEKNIVKASGKFWSKFSKRIPGCDTLRPIMQKRQ